jgi:hypothetical protein
MKNSLVNDKYRDCFAKSGFAIWFVPKDLTNVAW